MTADCDELLDQLQELAEALDSLQAELEFDRETLEHLEDDLTRSIEGLMRIWYDVGPYTLGVITEGQESRRRDIADYENRIDKKEAKEDELVDKMNEVLGDWIECNHDETTENMEDQE